MRSATARTPPRSSPPSPSRSLRATTASWSPGRSSVTAPRGAEGGAFEATIVFVDVVSYTPLTDEHGDMVAIDVLRRLDGLVRALVARNRGDFVKQIGDALMLEFEAAPEAMRFCLALRDAVGGEGSLPSLRIGISSGPVRYGLGDYLGQTVNIAARLCDARGSRRDPHDRRRRRGGAAARRASGSGGRADAQGPSRPGIAVSPRGGAGGRGSLGGYDRGARVSIIGLNVASARCVRLRA